MDGLHDDALRSFYGGLLVGGGLLWVGAPPLAAWLLGVFVASSVARWRAGGPAGLSRPAAFGSALASGLSLAGFALASGLSDAFLWPVEAAAARGDDICGMGGLSAVYLAGLGLALGHVVLTRLGRKRPPAEPPPASF